MRGALVLVFASISVALAGCDAGGLLTVHAKDADAGADGGVPVVLGPSANEMVGAGNVAGNGKYKIVYTFGQPTPNQDVAKSPGNQLNGGVVGAAEGNNK